MGEALYVATDSSGVQHASTGEVSWRLPQGSKGQVTPGDPTVASHGALELRSAFGLLEVLDEQIFLAEHDEDDPQLQDGTLAVRTARLVERARWDVEVAAAFALDCVEHVLGEAGATTLPDGTRLDEIVREARGELETTSASGPARIGLLSRLAAARRVRHLGESVGELALGQLADDTAAAIESHEDPVWATLAALGDGLLAALEAVRHFALPRYVALREEPLDEHPQDGPSTSATPFITPWGPIMIGAEHRSPFEPAWTAARDAAARAREVARDRGGEAAELAERHWQASRLDELLLG